MAWKTPLEIPLNRKIMLPARYQRAGETWLAYSYWKKSLYHHHIMYTLPFLFNSIFLFLLFLKALQIRERKDCQASKQLAWQVGKPALISAPAPSQKESLRNSLSMSHCSCLHMRTEVNPDYRLPWGKTHGKIMRHLVVATRSAKFRQSNILDNNLLTCQGSMQGKAFQNSRLNSNLKIQSTKIYITLF